MPGVNEPWFPYPHGQVARHSHPARREGRASRSTGQQSHERWAPRPALVVAAVIVLAAAAGLAIWKLASSPGSSQAGPRRAIPSASALPPGKSHGGRALGDGTRTTAKTNPPAPLRPGHTVRILLAGDSLARTLGAGLEDAGGPYGAKITTVSVPGCGLTGPGTYFWGGMVTASPPSCAGLFANFRVAVRQFHPDVTVLLAAKRPVANVLWHGRWTDLVDQPQYRSTVSAGVEQAIAALSIDHTPVVVLTVPYFAYATAPYQAPGTKACSPACNQHFPEDASARVSRYNQLLRQVAAQHHAPIVDLFARVDPGGRYAASIDGNEIRDPGGVNFDVPAAGEWLAGWLLPKLVHRLISNHAIPPAR